MILAQMLEIVALNDPASVLCARKFSFALQGGIYPRKCPLFSKNGFKMALQVLMIFAQMLEIVSLSDLALVLCARKFSFALQGD